MSIIEFLKADKKRAGVIISIIILLIGVVPLIIFTFFADPAHPYTITQETLISEDGTEIQALIYTPLTASGSIPGVVLAHGYCGSKGSLHNIGIELVKRNFLVVNIDFRGHGASGGYLSRDPEGYEKLEMDVMAGVQYLKDSGVVDKIGLMGHSMGAGTVRRVAEKIPNQINATVSMGSIPSSANTTLIPNLLVALGQFEQAMVVDSSLDFLKNYTGLTNVAFDTLYGDFTDGNATKVAIGPFSEHLYERSDPVIIYEIVNWFELAFYGSVRWEIVITSVFQNAFFYISIFGSVCLCFVVIIYLSKFIWKDKTMDIRKDLTKNTSIFLLLLYSIIIGIISLLSYLIFADLFVDVVTFSAGDQIFAFNFGFALGVLIVYSLLVLRKERVGIKDLPMKFKELTSNNAASSLIYGVATAIILIIGITSISFWSQSPGWPTSRELGTIIGLTFIFFPLLFVKEFYFRTVQSKLNFSNRFKEYFSMVFIGIFMETVVTVPLALLTWGSANSMLSFISLSLTATFIMAVIQQILVTWVYMHSGRNIVGSTVFLCIFYSWIMINFFPFA